MQRPRQLKMKLVANAYMTICYCKIYNLLSKSNLYRTSIQFLALSCTLLMHFAHFNSFFCAKTFNLPLNVFIYQNKSIECIPCISIFLKEKKCLVFKNIVMSDVNDEIFTRFELMTLFIQILPIFGFIKNYIFTNAGLYRNVQWFGHLFQLSFFFLYWHV